MLLNAAMVLVRPFLDVPKSRLVATLEKALTVPELPGIRGCHILEGPGHWVQQERPDEVNRLLLDFLAGL